MDPSAVRNAIKSVAEKVGAVRTGTVMSDIGHKAQIVLDGPSTSPVEAVSMGDSLPAGTRVSLLAFPPRGLLVLGPLDYTPIASAVAPINAELLSAFPLGVGAWTNYTPSWTQSATISKTINRAAYQKVGRICVVSVRMIATSAGTANNVINVGLPVPAAATIGYAAGQFFFDDSGIGFYNGVAYIDNVNTVRFYWGGQSGSAPAFGQTGGGFSAAIASNDMMTFTVVYETAS